MNIKISTVIKISLLLVIIFLSLFVLLELIIKDNTAKSREKEHLVISGKIGVDVSYLIKVRYIADTSKKSCQKKKWSLLGTSYVPDTETYKYYPLIKDGFHRLNIPLAELDPFDDCRYRPQNIKICVKEDSFSLSCSTLFATNIKPEGIYYKSKKVVNIECLKDIYRRCFLAPLNEKLPIGQRLTNDSLEYKVNIKIL